MTNAVAKKGRPKYLSLPALLFEIRQPPSAVVSILHRVSGAMLFVGTVWLLYLLDRSLASEAGFAQVRHYVGRLPVKIGLLVLIWAYCHHFCAGIRFLLLDLNKGWNKPVFRRSALAVFAASLALTAISGVLLW